uniref:Uncharacterized protein n=1 Tax=Hemiselmis andersenii TaxID=464988 RepID=A0A7S1DJX0_HEMAN|mmetsp:Transcript_15662/g.37981  ORF Transcript_15662/g.37981 Transcript_15662/m.37981 type:complete len:143 (+) Transcript_15662:378-806(+)
MLVGVALSLCCRRAPRTDSPLRPRTRARRPAILMLTNIVISFLVMMDYFSEEREGFYQGCVSTGTVYLMFQLLTYVVYGATLCKWDADQCDDLRYTSVVFAGMSIFSELAFFVAFSIYLAKSSPSKGFGVTRSGAKQTNASV